MRESILSGAGDRESGKGLEAKVPSLTAGVHGRRKTSLVNVTYFYMEN